jgi:hypothetical protein
MSGQGIFLKKVTFGHFFVQNTEKTFFFNFLILKRISKNYLIKKKIMD